MPPDNELDFLRWLEETDTGSPSVDVPIGDDAAVVRWGATRVVVAADAVAEASGDEQRHGRAFTARAAGRSTAEISMRWRSCATIRRTRDGHQD